MIAILALTGNLTLIGLAIRDRFRPLFPFLRFTVGMRKELRGIYREIRRINNLIGR